MSRNNEAIIAAGDRLLKQVKEVMVEMVQADAPANIMKMMVMTSSYLEHLACSLEEECLHDNSPQYPPEIEAIYQTALSNLLKGIGALSQIEPETKVAMSSYVIDFCSAMSSLEHDGRFLVREKEEEEVATTIHVEGFGGSIGISVEGELPPGVSPDLVKKRIAEAMRNVGESLRETIEEEVNQPNARPPRGMVRQRGRRQWASFGLGRPSND